MKLMCNAGSQYGISRRFLFPEDSYLRGEILISRRFLFPEDVLVQSRRELFLVFKALFLCLHGLLLIMFRNRNATGNDFSTIYSIIIYFLTITITIMVTECCTPLCEFANSHAYLKNFRR